MVGSQKLTLQTLIEYFNLDESKCIKGDYFLNI
jgi:hypothetical protein